MAITAATGITMLKDVVGYEGIYWVSSEGDVFTRSGRALRLQKGTGGYLRCSLWRDGSAKTVLVHRLVALAHLEGGEGMEVNHKNGIKTDNNLSNLEWVTRSQNQIHSYRILGRKVVMPRYAKGEMPLACLQRPKGSADLRSIAICGVAKEIGFVYPCISQVAADGFDPSHVVKCLRGLRRKHAGLTWSAVRAIERG